MNLLPKALNPREPIPNPEYRTIVNVTSRSRDQYRGLSPFILSVDKYHSCLGGDRAKNVENAWQFSKVYEQHWDGEKPTKEWWDWRKKGFEDTYAHRYPMGKGAKPLCSWSPVLGKLTYTEARCKIYYPVYKEAYLSSPLAAKLSKERSPVIIDFDVFDHYDGPDPEEGLQGLRKIIVDPTKKFGHGFVILSILYQELISK